MNRKLIRPDLSEIKDNLPGGRVHRQRKATPAEQTHAENFYYVKQMAGRTPMVIVLTDGEELRGVIEWYDRYALKVNREGEPNVLLFKHAIRYMYKEGDEEEEDA